MEAIMKAVLACLLMLVPEACAYPERPSYGFSAVPVQPESGMLSRVVTVVGVQCNTPAAKVVRNGDQILILNGIVVPHATVYRHNVALGILKNPKVSIEGKILRINGRHQTLIDYRFEPLMVRGPFVNPESC